MAFGYFDYDFGNSLAQPQVLHQNRAYRGTYRYPHHNLKFYAVALTVSVMGVSLTITREHFTQSVAAMLLIVAP